MWKNLGRVFWILISSELFVVNCEYFSIVGPKTLRVDEPYKVAVTSHDQNGEISRILVGLEGIGFDGEEFEISEDVEVSGGKTKIVKLKVRILCFFKSFFKSLHSTAFKFVIGKVQFNSFERQLLQICFSLLQLTKSFSARSAKQAHLQA